MKTIFYLAIYWFVFFFFFFFPKAFKKQIKVLSFFSLSRYLWNLKLLDIQENITIFLYLANNHKNKIRKRKRKQNNNNKTVLVQLLLIISLLLHSYLYNLLVYGFCLLCVQHKILNTYVTKSPRELIWRDWRLD